MFFGVIATLFFFVLSTYDSGMQKVFLCLAFFEFCAVALHPCRNGFTITVHFIYQTMVFLVPTFLFACCIYKDNEDRLNEIRLRYDLKPNLDFLKANGWECFRGIIDHCSIFWLAVLCIVWTVRILHTHFLLIDWNTKDRLNNPETRDLGPIKQSSLHILLNVIFASIFSTIAYYSEYSELFIRLAVIEWLMTFSYVIKNSGIMLLHFVFQAKVFFMVFSTYCIAMMYEIWKPEMTIFLDSQKCHFMIVFLEKESFLVMTVFAAAWFFRMVTTHIFLVEVATDYQVRGCQAQRQFNRLVEDI
ncbi:hypothetical protein L5515_004743 [Caenorhabditis briggsae]|nr:hypothetical protein L5515_004743 [Caenorhabditis briggsae]